MPIPLHSPGHLALPAIFITFLALFKSLTIMLFQLGIFGLTAYSASKFAIRGFAESFFMEVRRKRKNVPLVIALETLVYKY